MQLQPYGQQLSVGPFWILIDILAQFRGLYGAYFKPGATFEVLHYKDDLDHVALNVV